MHINKTNYKYKQHKLASLLLFLIPSKMSTKTRNPSMILLRHCRKFRKWSELNKMVYFSCQRYMKRSENPHKTKSHKQKISTHILWNALNFATMAFSLAIKSCKVVILTYFGLNGTSQLKSHFVKQDSFHLKQCNLMVHIQEWLLELSLWFILYHRRPH